MDERILNISRKLENLNRDTLNAYKDKVDDETWNFMYDLSSNVKIAFDDLANLD